MAKVELNETLGGLRGKIDGWVYRKQDGQTIVACYRAARPGRQSAAQKQTRVRFRAAQAYAASVLANPLWRAVYQKLGADRKQPPNALLVANFLTPPVIDRIDLAGYRGKAGGIVRVVAFDSIEVSGVVVTIRDSRGTELESGAATPEHGVWSYHATASAPPEAELQIEVRARNRAGAEAKQSVSR